MKKGNGGDISTEKIKKMKGAFYGKRGKKEMDSI